MLVIGAAVPSALGATCPGQGGARQDARRRAFNACVGSGELFEHYTDIDAVLTDPSSGRLHSRYNRDSTVGERGDGVHPHWAGHAAMSQRIWECLPR